MQKSKTLHRSRTKNQFGHQRQQSNVSEPQKKEFDPRLYQKFIDFLTRTRLQKLRQKLTYFYGRNFPIAYQQKYNFLEEWQGLQRRQQKNLNDLIQSENMLIQIICLFIMVTNTFIVWNITVERVFRSETQQSQLYYNVLALGIVNRIVSSMLRLYLQFKRNENKLTLKSVCFILSKDIFCVIYFILGLSYLIHQNPIIIVSEILISAYLYLQARKYYKYLRIIELTLVYQYQFKVFDLMVNLFIIAHSLSILLYMGTFYDQRTNWMSSMHADLEDYLIKYMYAFYFCSTTILTIGYGDITPKNKLQYVLVIIVQFFGVIIFGYLIAQIGNTLSMIRKNEENLQKDLTTLKKIENFYNLENKLVNQAKGFLVSNQNVMVELTPDEENNLLAKLNQELRTVIVNEKSLSIVKTSIFFLCRWSRDMQTHVASKLQRALYAPNERLPQQPTKERIYIIKRGKIQIYCDRYGHSRKEYRRLMKTIKIKEENQICENIYGYTAVFSLRENTLDAISSQFTSCHYIQKSQFLKCANSRQVDLEYYHEIKSRIDQSEFCQAFQTPSILNIREHYNPSRTILIRKNRAILSKLTNQRDFFQRCSKRRVKKHYFKVLSKIIEEINDKLIYNSNDYIEYKSDNIEQIQVQEETIRETTQVESKKGSISAPNDFGHSNSLNHNNNNSGSKTEIFQSLLKKSFHHYFERAQEYKNFFFSNNLSEVIKRIENQNYNFNKKQDDFLSIKMYTNKEIDFCFKPIRKVKKSKNI